jgi:hypothetical protein
MHDRHCVLHSEEQIFLTQIILGFKRGFLHFRGSIKILLYYIHDTIPENHQRLNFSIL